VSTGQYRVVCMMSTVCATSHIPAVSTG
jgi:hypothetical protein